MVVGALLLSMLQRRRKIRPGVSTSKPHTKGEKKLLFLRRSFASEPTKQGRCYESSRGELAW